MSKENFKHIALLSTHGYFDPVPQLGRTDTGGQVVYVLEMAKAMAKKGIKVDIFTRWFEREKQQEDPVPGHPNVRVVRIHAGPWKFRPKEFIYELLPELATNMLNYVHEKEIDYDLYHGHYVDAGIVTLILAKALNKPAFFTAHSLGAWKKDQMGGDPEEMEKKFNFEHRISEEMRIFKEVNGQTLTSIVQHEKLQELYKYDADNIEIIPPGVDIERFYMPSENDLRKPSNLPDKYIYCMSRIDTNKGHDHLLRAFALVKDEIPDVDLVIGGGSPNPKPREVELFDKMHAIIAEEDMEDRVEFIGYVPDKMMTQYYQQAQLFVLPSQFEPFGMTSQESMACGTPVVASKFGGIRNAITHNENGLLIDPTDKEEFAQAMIKVLKDNEYRERIGKAAHKLIIDEYSWEAIADRFLDFYAKYQ
ncbi:MAG: glycosyltransferase [Bacteroidetes bacterium]|nr:glycosyltransferase [Bacteroidota bacterium]